MLSKIRSTPVRAPAPGVIPDTSMGPVSSGSPIPADVDIAATGPAATTARETRRERSRRKAHRSRLHVYAIATVAVVALLIALAVSNTRQVKVNWLFATSHVSLVWLVLFAAILGWVLGLVATAAFHWRTRAPRRQRPR
jgi:uncharacterized integral membrane protein